MTYNIKSLIEHINSLLTISSYDDILENGVQVEGNRKEIKKIATGVTASSFVVEQAAKINADLVITHHGLFVKNSISNLTGNIKKRVHTLLAHGITLLSYHLPLDGHVHLGNAWALPIDFEWTHVEPFCFYKGGAIGVIIHLSSSIQAKTLHEILRNYWRSAYNDQFLILPEKQIQKIAFIPGQGHKFIQEVLQKEVDCFITGTSDEPLWHIAHDANISYMCFGHHATERRGVQKLGEYIAKLYDIEHTFIDEKNPF